MSHYEFTWATGTFLILISMGLMGGVFYWGLKVLEFIVYFVLGIALLLFTLPIILLEFIITGETTIGKHFTVLRFLNKEKKERLFDDW